MSAPVVFLGLLAQRKAAATQWSAPVTPGGGSADFDQRPLRITVWSRKGSSGFMMNGNLPASRTGFSGIQYPGAMPCGTKIPVKRVFAPAAVFAKGVCAGTMESNNGNASATPAPLRTVRREMCFLVISIAYPFQFPFMILFLPLPHGRGSAGD